MKTVINGAGQDTTQEVLAWLKAGRGLTLANLYLIGEPEHPQAQWLTDWESPLHWSVMAMGGVPLADGGPIIFTGAPITYVTDWEDQGSLGDHSWGNGSCRVQFDKNGFAYLKYLGTLGGTTLRNDFGWDGVKYVGMNMGTGPVKLPHQFAPGEELILRMFVNGSISPNSAWYSGPGSRNSDGYVHEHLSVARDSFPPAVISRGAVTSKIGLDVAALDVKWTPRSAVWSNSVYAANPYQLAHMGFYDGWPVRVWRVYMPTPGDADTFGCSELFGGRVGNCSIEKGAIKLTVNSFLDVVNQNTPTNVIELTNPMASYSAATPPAGVTSVPQFNVITGDSPTMVIGDCISPSAHHVWDKNKLKGGYLVFGPGTLQGIWRPIQANDKVTIGGVDYNQIILYSPLPWTPTPGTDTFYISASAPIDQADGDYFGFPYVPDPSMGI